MLFSGCYSTSFDPLEHFGIHSRQILCDAVIKAKQFMLKYTDTNPKNQRSKFYEFDPDDGGIMNYQRFASTSQDPDPAHLHYTNNVQVVRFGNKGYMRMKSVQCVDMITLQLNLTFGGVDKFCYALEKVLDKNKRTYFRITGMLEPSALIQDRNAKYFRNQLKNSKSR